MNEEATQRKTGREGQQERQTRKSARKPGKEYLMQKLKNALLEEQKRLERIVDEARNEKIDRPEG